MPMSSACSLSLSLSLSFSLSALSGPLMLIVGNGEPRYLLVQLVNIHEAIVNLQGGSFPSPLQSHYCNFTLRTKLFVPLMSTK